MRFLVALTIFTLLFITCKKDDHEPMQINFGGITSIDNDGSFRGSVDSTDWGFSEIDPTLINDLFGKSDTDICMDIEANKAFPGYPNPSLGGTIGFEYMLSEPSSLNLRFVDRNFNPVYSEDHTLPEGRIFIVIPDDSIPIQNDTIRLYYSIVRPDCKMFGFGDIVMK